MKTPEEIKKGLTICTHGSDCSRCTYTLLECSKNQMQKDALTYIQHLENLLTQATTERVALLADLVNAKWFLCHVCKNYYRPDPVIRHYECKALGKFSDFIDGDCDSIIHCGKFDWRGVCAENSK